MKTNNRSKAFEYFDPNGQNSKKKSTWKKVWLWIRIVLYTLIFGLTLTGCVQSIVVKTSSYSGGGTEFYLNKNDIAPSVASFEKGKTAKNDENLESGQFYSLTHLREKNYLLSNKDNPTTLKAIQEQTNLNGGEYGKYGSYSSSIQYITKDGKYASNEPILFGNGRYLFKAASSTSYDSIFTDFNTITILDPAFKFENFFTKNEDGTYTLKANNDEAFKIKATYYDPSTNKFLDNKNQENVYDIKEASLVNVSNEINSEHENLRFNRDVLEFLYRYTFTEESENTYYINAIQNLSLDGTTVNEKYNSLLNKIVVEKQLERALTAKEFHALVKYNETIVQYLKDTNLYSIQDQDKIIAKVKDGSDAKDAKGNTIYTAYAKNGLVLGNYNNDVTKLAYQNTEPQKAIYSWKGAWGLGPFFSLIAYPMAIVTSGIRNPLPGAFGWSTILAIVVAVIVTRLIGLAFTWKATMSQARQEELRQKKAKIDAKYAEFKGNKQMRARQQQEIQQLYKKHNINPIDMLVSTLIALPIFIAMWRVIQSVPTLKSTHWLGMDFSATSWRRLIYDGEWQYLGLLIVAISTQILSQIIPRLLNRKKFKQRMTAEEIKAVKKSNRTQNYMLIFFVFITVVFAAGVQVYWIFTSIWTIIQTLAIHYFKKSDYYRRKYATKIEI